MSRNAWPNELLRRLPECSGCGNTEGHCIDGIRGGAIKCCPDCKHYGRVEARELWWCEYTEFQDPACHTEHENARPELTRQPHKHSACRWVLIAEVPE